MSNVGLVSSVGILGGNAWLAAWGVPPSISCQPDPPRTPTPRFCRKVPSARVTHCFAQMLTSQSFHLEMSVTTLPGWVGGGYEPQTAVTVGGRCRQGTVRTVGSWLAFLIPWSIESTNSRLVIIRIPKSIAINSSLIKLSSCRIEYCSLSTNHSLGRVFRSRLFLSLIIWWCGFGFWAGAYQHK